MLEAEGRRSRSTEGWRKTYTYGQLLLAFEDQAPLFAVRRPTAAPRHSTPLPPFPRSLRGPGPGIAYYLLPQLSEAQFAHSIDTNWWLGQRHQVAREAGAAGSLLVVARGGEKLEASQIGHEYWQVSIGPAPDHRSNGSVVEAMLTVEGKGLAP